MIQFNLLPDIKLEFIKAKRSKRIVMAVSLLTSLVSLVLLALMFSFNTFQKSHISGLTSDIKKAEGRLQSIPDLARILTIQNQLNTLPALYEQRPATSRLFDYLEQTTPTKVSITHLKVNFEASTVEIDGTSDALESVNQYVDTLKFTKYTLGEEKTESNSFTDVVLSAFSLSKNTSFKVSAKFDPVIFNDSADVKLAVPQTVSTRSETELPTGVFDAEEN